MTIVGAGGIRFLRPSMTPKFKRDYKKLDPAMQERVDEKLRGVFANPMPSGIRFEKLKGYSNPDIYTIHVDGNYKISLAHATEEEDGKKISVAIFRRVCAHDEIDRKP